MRKFWTEGEKVSMRELYPYFPTPWVALQLRRSEKAVNYMAHHMGLKKHPSFYEKFGGGRLHKAHRRGCNTQYKKGQIPWNKGTSYHAGGRSCETQFKKGNTPPKTLYDGAITVRIDSRGVPVKMIRLAPKKWEYLARYTWKQHHGEIPAGHNIIHIDGDTMNCNIENLACISRRENMRRNSIVNYPPELRSTIHSLSKLKKVINEKQDH